MQRQVAAFIIVLAVLGACGSDAGERSTEPYEAPDTSDVVEPPTITTSKPIRDMSNTEVVCHDFMNITADFTLSDEESAAAFFQLARHAEDPQLREAIEEVARGFERHDDAIYNDRVMAICE